jgi:uncharacterized protein YpbB
MSNNKQSSVEWFLDKLIEHEIIKIGQTTYGGNVNYKHEILFEQAKAMHREEHGKTWDESMDNFIARGENYVRANVDFDDYYDETFGGNK